MIIISNSAHYHTPYQVEALYSNNYRNLKYFTGVNPMRISKICKSVPNMNIRNYFDIFLLNKILNKLNFKNVSSSVTLDERYDCRVAKYLSKFREAVDIFHGFNGSCLYSLDSVGDRCIKIVECGIHPRFYQDIVVKESNTLGNPITPLSNEYIERSDQEFKKADVILTISQLSKRSFVENGYEYEKIQVVPLGADVSEYYRTKERDRMFRILYVGRVCALKGVHYLIDAVEDLLKLNYNVYCDIVGPIYDGFMKQYQERYKNSDRILFHGPKNSVELRDLYSAASVFVMPSLIDSFCMCVYESLACKTPVIITENVGAPIEDSKHGFIIPIRDSKAISDKIKIMFENRGLIEQYGNNGYQLVKQSTWNEYGRKLIQFYSTLIKGEKM